MKDHLDPMFLVDKLEGSLFCYGPSDDTVDTVLWAWLRVLVLLSALDAEGAFDHTSVPLPV